MEKSDLLGEFKEKAALVSSVVHEVETLQDALKTAVNICGQHVSTDDFHSSSSKTVAAPDLNESSRDILKQLCEEAGVTLLSDAMRDHGNGIDVGITFADYGIAETGTLVVCSDSEERRLASMLSEVHVALLPLSRIRPSALAITEELKALTVKTSSYMAFITGPSRTADIERVLAIGVHGPLELHVILFHDGDAEGYDGADRAGKESSEANDTAGASVVSSRVETAKA